VADFPYTPNPASLKRFLELIPSIGVPGKVTREFLKSVGFKSGNDNYIIPILKDLDFLDSGAAPTANWQKYRSKGTAGAVMATAVRAAYPELFVAYPDANRKDNEALRNYFSTHSRAAETTIGLVVRTFKTLCELADFDAEDTSFQPDQSKKLSRGFPVKQQQASTQSAVTVNVNVQLQLQATDDASIYDKFFAAMKKHLFPSE
jgi:hypothetical protein